MSYILEALKRADAEREREAAGVPGLHAQARDFDGDDADAADRGTRQNWALAGLLGVLTLSFLGWFFWPRQPAVVVAVAPPVPQIVVPAPSPPPPPLSAAPLPALQTAPLPELPTLAPPPEKTLPETRPRVRTQPEAAPASAPQEPRTYRLSELPDNIRQELPSLSLGGVMYSGQASHRMVVVNGQVFREGDTLAPNVVLRQIKLKEAILEFKGYRYGVKY